MTEPAPAAHRVASTATRMVRGLRLRCPYCGKGRLFARTITRVSECAVCHRSLRYGGGEWSGAMMVNQFFFGVVAILTFMVLSIFTNLAIMPRVLVTLGVALIVVLALYRNMKGLWFGFVFGVDEA